MSTPPPDAPGGPLCPARLRRWLDGAADAALDALGLPRSAWGVERWHASTLDAPAAADRGAVATPQVLAQALAAAVIDPLAQVGRVVDPAVGGGALLLAAAERLEARGAGSRPQIVAQLRGMDLDRASVGVAEVVLEAWSGAPVPEGVLVVGDSVGGSPPEGEVLLANPPWVDAVRHTRVDPSGRAALAQALPLRGAWDLWCAAVLRWWAAGPWTAAGLWLPNRVQSVGYAAEVRAALGAGLVELLRPAVGFDRAVYPLGLVWDPARGGPRVTQRSVGAGGGVPGPSLARTEDGAPWGAPSAREASEGPLGDRVEVSGAMTVAEAYEVGHALAEADAAEGAPLVNTGLIDPFVNLWDTKTARVVGRKLQRPVLPSPTACLSPRRQAQLRSPKVVLAGLSRRLEAWADLDGRWLAGKSTVVILAEADEVAWLTAWLNAPSTTAAWRAENEGRALRGGYLSLGPGQIRALGWPRLGAAQRAALAEATRTWQDHGLPDDWEARLSRIVDGRLGGR